MRSASHGIRSTTSGGPADPGRDPATRRAQHRDADPAGASRPTAEPPPPLRDAHDSWPMDRQATTSFPGVPASVGRARQFVRVTSAMWHLSPETEGDAELCMSELVGNAVTHTTSAQLQCRLWSAHGMLFLEVDDEDRRDVPEMERATDEDEHGRGMLLIDAFASAWGTTPLPGRDGKTVWAALPLGA